MIQNTSVKTVKSRKVIGRNFLTALLFSIITVFNSSAEEGMLIPSLLAAFEDDMQAMGMKLTAEDIYSVNHSSLKDAILHFGGGCTAELVSSQGLLLTNHHCGYSRIQSHSSVEKNYLRDGFWAKDKSEELKNPGLTAARVVRIENVTETALFGCEGLSGDALVTQMRKNFEAIVKDATLNNHYSAKVAAFNQGNDYYMVVKETFTDIRLVGTPPNSIGKFGGDTDNWVWPRHTGDFSVFRIYSDANNAPSEISDSNIPYTPLHFLPVSMKDRNVGDFTMIYGFPGTTEQHLSSGNLEFIMNDLRPAQIKMRDKSIGVINASMNSSDQLRIMYSSKQARIANAWKKWIGQIGGLKTVDAIQIKLDREKRFNDMANSKLEWKEKYGTIISEMNGLMKKNESFEFGHNIYLEYFYYAGPEMFKRAMAMDKFIKEYMALAEGSDDEAIVEKQKKGADSFFKNYDEETDKRIFTLMTEEFKTQMKDDVPEMLKNKSTEDLAEAIYSKSILTNKDRFLKFLDKVKVKSFSKLAKKDVGYMLWDEVIGVYRSKMAPGYYNYKDEMDVLLKIYVAGKMEMFPDDNHWPDANSTLRVTYGKLEGSAPHDGMTYTAHTTVDGMIAKNNTGNPDFELLPKMKDLAAKREWGPYAQDGELWVCFSGSNHTTGGNSGSPVIDAEGNLMGLNFDRTWESTMSDFMFDSSRCRNIAVDIRYVMWVMDIYGGAGYLVDEMTMAK